MLVVDDDVALGKFLHRELCRRSFCVEVRHDGEEACRALEAGHFDLVLLDLNLPKMDGVSILRQIRKNHPQMPVLVLTARNRTEDLVSVLDQGADDCLFKPFSFLELLARVKSLLRRSTLPSVPALAAAPAPAQSENFARVGDLVVNREEHWVQRGARRVELTTREFALLEFLLNNVGKAVSRATLLKEVWNIQHDSTTNIVDVYMKYLRDKIDVEGEPKLIRTVRGVGYVLSNE